MSLKRSFEDCMYSFALDLAASKKVKLERQNLELEQAHPGWNKHCNSKHFKGWYQLQPTYLRTSRTTYELISAMDAYKIYCRMEFVNAQSGEKGG